MAVTKTHPIKSTLSQGSRHGNVENCRLCRWKTYSRTMEKGKSFPQDRKQVSYSNARYGSLHTFLQRLLLRLSIRSFYILRGEKEKSKKEWEYNPRANRESCTPVLRLENGTEIILH